MTFIYFLISAVVFYYLFKIGIRLLMPFFMKKVAEKIMNGAQGQYANGGPNQQNYNDPFSQFKQQQQQRPDGKVRVEYMPPKEHKAKKGTETAGEFIDFEEVK
ncbi:MULTISPECIES: DUF4834 family protein [Sphingobacterium]|nr:MULTISPECIES: DUF4834 family protein [Sphingobacterium]OYD43882.1 hypothetical protein CHT99_02625 [Sphingobacterium cellulitidis]OYD47142.1 hypothetical protein CHU00_03510 [Sphingobacterium cellulitidis]WFB64052.1 DUF4834 family protein [Sphingobacterium sp. WM]